MDRIVVVGASLAGTRAVQRLRSDGFVGDLVLIGEELDGLYDRPPLSKQVLTSEWLRDDIGLLSPHELDQLNLSLRLGTRAERLSVEKRELQLSDGTSITYDGLIIATGARARGMKGVSRSDRVHLLRTSSDATELAKALTPGLRLGVLGGGFIGSEVASSARQRGVEVTILERDSIPMAASLGERIGSHIAELQRSRGVDLRTHSLVTEVIDDGTHVTVGMADGTSMAFDHVLVSIGAEPNVEWLANSGLEVEGAVITDSKLFAAPDVVAAGDVASVRRSKGVLLDRVEHWTNAAAQGDAAAGNLLLGHKAAEDFRSVPYIWSDQFGSRVEVLGTPSRADRVEEIWSSADRRAVLFACYVDNTVEALVGINAMRWLVRVRRVLQGATRLDSGAVAELMAAVRNAS